MSQTLSIVKPNAATQGFTGSTTPISVSVQSPALFQILEFAVRAAQDSKVIGALVGQRSEDGSLYEVRDAYLVGHKDEGDEVTIEEAQHRAQLALHKRSHPKDTLLGWFSTSPKIDSFTTVIHEFMTKSSDGAIVNPAIHLTLEHDLQEGQTLKEVPTINTYIGTSIGASSAAAANLKIVYKGASYLFTPVANKITHGVSERAILNIASKQVFEEKQSVDILGGTGVDLASLSEHLSKMDTLIQSTIEYIESIEKGEVQANEEFGKFLLANLKNNVDSVNLEDLEKTFNSHIQDVLMIEYLTSSIKTQLDLSSKLATLV
ncbi:hypothetical protein WICPIJ_007702 [Wickerhamomyces pijperi]|uniref:MPN domain-containing protein n=1 Tax=Wickerhamomyces pijperi TaxID=599730 RepID=A0A9P8TJQ3_WICPI|nr:hypothetical protein WICPIJ_007702 [Wickerhamomyces pijperi]